MKEGDIVLTAMPQSDGHIKNRPAVVLREMPPFGDLLVCGVSAQLQQRVAGFDQVIKPGDSDFVESGLKSPSLIRLGFLAVLPLRSFLGAIGSVSSDRHKQLFRRLSKHLSPG